MLNKTITVHVVLFFVRAQMLLLADLSIVHFKYFWVLCTVKAGEQKNREEES